MSTYPIASFNVKKKKVKNRWQKRNKKIREEGRVLDLFFTLYSMHGFFLLNFRRQIFFLFFKKQMIKIRLKVLKEKKLSHPQDIFSLSSSFYPPHPFFLSSLIFFFFLETVVSNSNHLLLSKTYGLKFQEKGRMQVNEGLPFSDAHFLMKSSSSSAHVFYFIFFFCMFQYVGNDILQGRYFQLKKRKKKN